MPPKRGKPRAANGGSAVTNNARSRILGRYLNAGIFTRVNDINYSLIYTPLAKTQCSCSHCGGWSCCLGSRISAFCFLRQNCERRLDTCIPQGQRKGPINMRCPLVRQDTQQKFSRDGVVI
jgi:hypothetical protein